MPAIPTTEPDSITAGDTVAWTKSLPDYPATSYTLRYALQRVGAALITITATASGSNYAVSVPAATSADWAPGVYTRTAYVESGTERYTIARDTFTVRPSAVDELGSTHASRTLALIDAAIEGRIPNGLQTSTIDGQTLERIPLTELFSLRQKYQQMVNNETLAARSAAGLPARRTIGFRFVKP